MGDKVWLPNAIALFLPFHVRYRTRRLRRVNEPDGQFKASRLGGMEVAPFFIGH